MGEIVCGLVGVFVCVCGIVGGCVGVCGLLVKGMKVVRRSSG